MDDLEHIESTPETTPTEASTQTSEAVEEVKKEVDERDSAILAELRGLREDIRSQTEAHIRHLEAHSTHAETLPVASEPSSAPTGEHSESKLPDEPVSLEISEPSDMPKEETKKKRRKFGKKR